MDLSAMGMRILVNDFQACYDFYTKTLGLELYWGDRKGPFAAFCAKGDDLPCLSIFRAKDMTKFKGYRFQEGTGRRDQALHVIPTDNADRDYAALKAKGVQFLGEPQTMGEWVMRCTYFRDPDGNLFELCQDLSEE